MIRAFEAYSRARSLAAFRRSGEAVDLLDQVVHESRDVHPRMVQAELVALGVEILVGERRFEDASRRLVGLQALDPWRAALETAWTGYFTQAPSSQLARLEALAQGAAERPARDRGRLYLLAGKLDSDAGHLAAARSLLLAATREARQCLDLDLLAACYGAIGEVLYLAGLPLQALDLFTLDASLLAPGSRWTERLMVYRAHCYRQLGCTEAARSLYHEALHACSARGESGAYPLRGLLWCAALDGAAGSPHARIQMERLLLELRRAKDPHCLAHGLVAMAWSARHGRAGAGCATLLAEARDVFQQGNYPVESFWCAALAGEGDPRPATTGAPLPINGGSNDGADPPAPAQAGQGSAGFSDATSLTGSCPAPAACDSWLMAFDVPEWSLRCHRHLIDFRAGDAGAARRWMSLFF